MAVELVDYDRTVTAVSSGAAFSWTPSLSGADPGDLIVVHVGIAQTGGSVPNVFLWNAGFTITRTTSLLFHRGWTGYGEFGTFTGTLATTTTVSATTAFVAHAYVVRGLSGYEAGTADRHFTHYSTQSSANPFTVNLNDGFNGDQFSQLLDADQPFIISVGLNWRAEGATATNSAGATWYEESSLFETLGSPATVGYGTVGGITWEQINPTDIAPGDPVNTPSFTRTGPYGGSWWSATFLYFEPAAIPTPPIPVEPVPARPDFLDALRYSHTAHNRIVLRTPDCTTYELPLVDGQVTIDRNAKTWRTADLDIAIDALGTDERLALEKLTVQSGEVEIWSGIKYTDGTIDEVQLGRMRVDSLEINDSAVARIGAFDYALMLDEHPVDPGTGSLIPAGTDWRTAITTLVADTFTWTPCGWEQLVVIDPTCPRWAIPENAWNNTNRLTAILEWAESRECDFYNLDDGRFALAPKSDGSEPVWTVDSGDAGVLVQATQRFSREQQYNAVAITYEVPDGTYESIRGFVADTDPYSTTRWGGPFGKRVLVLDGIPADNLVEAEAVARRKLADNKGATRALSLTTVRNPTLRPGQVIEVVHPAIPGERHVIERVVHQLGAGLCQIECKLSRS